MKNTSIQSIKEEIQPNEVFYDLLGKPVKVVGGNQVHFCPFHDDKKTPNLYIYPDGRYYCFACKESGDVIDFFQNIKGITQFPEALKQFSERYAPRNLLNQPGKKKLPLGKIIETYPYRDEAGETLFEVVRFKPKEFRQRCPDGKGGWNWNLNGARRVLYCLPELISNNDQIYICEGEKDVHCLRNHGLTATTCPMGAGKWKEEYNGPLKGRMVIILPDNDESGQNHAIEVAKSLFEVVESIKVVHLSGLQNHGDVSDYLDTHTMEDFCKEVEETPLFKPNQLNILDKLETWNQIKELEIKIEWIIDRLIPKESVTILFGKGGIGKTWLVMDIARCIGSGVNYLGYKTQQVPVIFVDFENPLPVLNTRMQKLGDAENVYFWRMGNEFKPPKLDSSEWLQYKELPEGAVLIFDTLRASQGRDENDSQEMAKVMNRMKELRDLGFTIILLHHTAKNTDKNSKGSTAIVDLADHILGLTRVRQREGGQDAVAIDDVDGFDTDAVYYFGNYEKTRFEPHNVHLKLNPDRGFELAPDPEEETLKTMHQILQNSGALPKTEFSKECKQLGIGEKKARKLIDRGRGRFWTVENGEQKNTQLVTPIQFGSLAPPIGPAKLPN